MAASSTQYLCTPAYVYLVISVIALVVMIFQNMGSRSLYCLGMYECDTENVTLIFLVKIIYVIFWTWILNLICKQGYTAVSWFLVLLPFLLFFILLALMMWRV
jgi:hypothetical protein